MSGTVAIITRTKDRPLLLQRAAESVAKQSYRNFIWVVVNDGGDARAVQEVIDKCEVEGDRILLISNEHSLGMEAASNIGIRQSKSDYIVIHDDDDTLHEDFLSETVAFLESDAGRTYGGVTTGVEYVSEEIAGDEVIIHDRYPYMDWVKTIEFAELLAQNTLTTISFLYRRDLYDEIGGYKEELPVLGDWYFNIEFVLRADIKVLPEVLAFYHHRDQGEVAKTGIYSNSVIVSHDRHVEFSARCRNMLIREYRQDSGIVASVVSGYFANDLRHSFGGHERAMAGRSKPIQKSKTILDDFDRMWLVSLLLERKSEQKIFSKNKVPDFDFDTPVADLARFARQLGIPLRAPSNFDEKAYLDHYPDVANEVEQGNLSSAYEHYAFSGHSEGRMRPVKD